jgi:hypothetical protein
MPQQDNAPLCQPRQFDFGTAFAPKAEVTSGRICWVRNEFLCL